MKYHQDILIDRINQYLKINNRTINLKYGYCHGFSLLWLHCMASNQEQWFYETTHRLAECKTNQDFEKINNDVEKLISHIEWLQNSTSYDDHLNQLDVDELLESKRPVSISFLFNQETFFKTLTKIIHPNEMISLSGPTHTIGVMLKNNEYHLFDPNYSDGHAHSFNDLATLSNEVIDCLIKNNDPLKLLPLQINVTLREEDCLENTNHCTEQLNEEIYDELISGSSDLNQLGFKDLSNLYIACESGDTFAVNKLLEAGAYPNRIDQTRMSPLETAAYSGYHKIIELLLKHDAEMSQNQKWSPLNYAASHGHLECVKILIAHQAHLNTEDKKLESFHLALKNKDWQIVAYFLANIHIKIKKIMTCSDFIYLIKHKEDLIFAAKQLNDELTSDERRALKKALLQLCHLSLPFSLFAKSKMTINDDNSDRISLKSIS